MFEGIDAVGGQPVEPVAEQKQHGEPQYEGGDSRQQERQQRRDRICQLILLHSRLYAQRDTDNSRKKYAQKAELQRDKKAGPDLMERVLLGHIGNAEVLVYHHPFDVETEFLQERQIIPQRVVIRVDVCLRYAGSQNRPARIARCDVHYRVNDEGHADDGGDQEQNTLYDKFVHSSS